MSLHQFNPGKKSWKIYANTLTSISGDDLKLVPYDDKDLILEASGNGSILFKQDGITYTMADLSNAASGSASDINGLDDGLAIINNNDGSYFIGGGGSSVTTIGTNNTFYGYQSGYSITDGFQNVGIGSKSLYSNTVGDYNVAIGFESLFSLNNAFGNNNIAIGRLTLRSNISGTYNIGIGSYSLYYNTGNYNIAIGGASQYKNSSGSENISIGLNTLRNNTNSYDIAIGNYALENNTSGTKNIGIGYKSLYDNTIGTDNIGIGHLSLYKNINGVYNSSIGTNSLYNNTSGITNTSSGSFSLYDNTSGSYNTALGFYSGTNNTTGSNNIYIGYYASASGSNNSNEIVIGSDMLGNGSNTVTIGNSSITDNYFNGNIECGVNTQSTKLTVGYSIISKGGLTNSAAFGQKDLYNQSASNVALLQEQANGSSERTILNTKAGKNLNIRQGLSSSNLISWDGSYWNWGSTSQSGTSDNRVKHNEKVITNGLYIIEQLNPLFYQKTEQMLDENYNGDLSNYKWKYEAGLIAQDIIQIHDLSYLVTGGGKIEDDDGNLIDDKYYLCYQDIFVYNIAATKELNNIVQNQQTIINELNTKLQSLEYENLVIKSALNELLNEAGKSTI